MNINVTIFGQIISFALFVWFCMKYVWLPLISVIEKRQKEIADNLADAEYAKIESDRIKSETITCLQEAKIKARDIINHANMCKIQILNEAKCAADKEQKRIFSQMREQIVYEKNCAIEKLKKGIGNIIMEAVEKIIGHSVNETIDHSIVNKIIEELSSSYSKDKI